jgi:DNA-binding transcriptional regulator YiaG
MTFATKISNHTRRLGIAKVCAALNISRRTLEAWRYGTKPPRKVIQIGALALLDAIKTKEVA